MLLKTLTFQQQPKKKNRKKNGNLFKKVKNKSALELELKPLFFILNLELPQKAEIIKIKKFLLPKKKTEACRPTIYYSKSAAKTQRRLTGIKEKTALFFFSTFVASIKTKLST